MTPEERATKEATCGIPGCQKEKVRHYWWECWEGRAEEIRRAILAERERINFEFKCRHCDTGFRVWSSVLSTNLYCPVCRHVWEDTAIMEEPTDD